jgi:NTE family protein
MTESSPTSSLVSDRTLAKTALVLSGGGARGAYQVGALHGLHELLYGHRSLPFPILVGASAGSITNAFLGAHADDFPMAVRKLVDFWGGLSPEDVFRTDARTLARVGLSWAADLSLGSWIGTGRGRSLLVSDPLRRLLHERLDMDALGQSVERGLLRGFALTTTSYRTGLAVTFFDGPSSIEPWVRSTRIGIRQHLTIDHVMASSSIPLFFPAVSIDGTYYADGCIRLTAPLSPAIHLGADRILAISVRYPRAPDPASSSPPGQNDRCPTAADTAGLLLNALFLEALESDVERLERINATVDLLPRAVIAKHSTPLRRIPILVLRPSRDLGELVMQTLDRLPYLLRHLFRGLGATGKSGWDLLSYLAFDSEYTSRLLALGYSDVKARGAQIATFLGASDTESQRVGGVPRENRR